MTEHMYRVHIISQPEWEERACFDTHKWGDEKGQRYEGWAWCPVGWEASEEYIDHFGTDRWIEPALNKSWRSRSSAAARRDILNAAGYLAIVQRSAPVVWPADGEKSVPRREGSAELVEALRVLEKNGLRVSFV